MIVRTRHVQNMHPRLAKAGNPSAKIEEAHEVLAPVKGDWTIAASRWITGNNAHVYILCVTVNVGESFDAAETRLRRNVEKVAEAKGAAFLEYTGPARHASRDYLRAVELSFVCWRSVPLAKKKKAK